MKFKLEHGVIFAMALLLAINFLLFTPRTSPGPALEEHRASSWSSLSTGARALFEFLQARGHRVRRLEGRLETLGDAEMLFLLSPQEALAREEEAWLRRWVERGGTAVVAAGSGAARNVLGVTIEGGPGPVEVAPLNLHAAGLPAETYSLSIPTARRLKAPAGVLAPLSSDSKGKPIAALVRLGPGRVLFFADPGMLTNKGLEAADNGVVLDYLCRAWAPSGTILFDEYHHGYQGGGSFLAALWGTPHGFGIAQAVAALLIVALYRSRRLGPPIPLTKPVYREPLEFVDATAALARRARAASFALGILVEDLELLAGRKYGVRRKELAGFLSERFSPYASAYPLARRALDSGRVDPAGLVVLARELESLRDILEGEKCR